MYGWLDFVGSDLGYIKGDIGDSERSHKVNYNFTLSTACLITTYN